MADLESIYRQNADTVFRYLMSMTGSADLSEELTQETFYQAVKSIDKFDGSSKVSTWLCGIARNVWLTELRKRKKESPGLDDIPEQTSSSLECNYIDGLKALKRLNLTSSVKVFAPLSYGDSWIRNEISRRGKRMLGNRFHPLIEFLPRDEYNRIIVSCSTVVMPHFRPQAFGNILTALWLGARVFLSENNVLFAYFKRIGAVIFSIEHDLKESNPYVLSPLSENDVFQNRKAIKAFYSKDVMHIKNIEFVNTLNQ